MSINVNKLSAFTILKRGIESEVKNQIANDIIDDQVKALKERLKVELTPILQAVTFDHISSFSDLMKMRDEVRVQIRVDDDVFDSDNRERRVKHDLTMTKHKTKQATLNTGIGL